MMSTLFVDSQRICGSGTRGDATLRVHSTFHLARSGKFVLGWPLDEQRERQSQLGANTSLSLIRTRAIACVAG